MKRCFSLLAVLIIMFASTVAYGAEAGSCVTTIEEDEFNIPPSRIKYVMDWLSDSSGDVTEVGGVTFSGRIDSVEIYPDSGGTKPSDDYDVQILDSETGLDILNGDGTDMDDNDSTTLTHAHCYQLPLDGEGAKMVGVNKTLTLDISNAGDSKGGKIVVYVDP